MFRLDVVDTVSLCERKSCFYPGDYPPMSGVRNDNINHLQPGDVNTVSLTAFYWFGKVELDFRQLIFHL